MVVRVSPWGVGPLPVAHRAANTEALGNAWEIRPEKAIRTVSAEGQIQADADLDDRQFRRQSDFGGQVRAMAGIEVIQVQCAQVADGAYNKIHDILIRMKDLATQASGDQITNENLALLNTEFEQLQSELDRIAESSTYNGVNLVYSSAAGTVGFTFQIGASAEATDQIAVELNTVSSAALAVSSLEIGAAASAQTAMTSLDTALTSINTYMAELGAYQNRLQHTMDNLNVMIENYSASESAIRDVDMAFEMTEFTKSQILQQAGMAMLAQANMAPQQVLQLLG